MPPDDRMALVTGNGRDIGMVITRGLAAGARSLIDQHVVGDGRSS